MAGSPVSIRLFGDGNWVRRRGVLLADWLSRGGWKTVDPLYIWSAAAGLVAALVLILIASIMQAGRLR